MLITYVKILVLKSQFSYENNNNNYRKTSVCSIPEQNPVLYLKGCILAPSHSDWLQVSVIPPSWHQSPAGSHSIKEKSHREIAAGTTIFWTDSAAAAV